MVDFLTHKKKLVCVMLEFSRMNEILAVCITLQLAQKKNGHGTKQKLMNMWEEMCYGK